ncbi:MAG: M56 family metallopeptidase [Defluviitaleaceae bacterium]|nr:M56 family metallopeptidase [Defluviitaleaceae bacterium]
MTVPVILSELVRTVITMTLSGGLLAVVLLLIKPIVRHRLPKSAQYCFWLVALASFLIPISRIAALPAAIADIAPIHNVVERNVISTAEVRNRPPDMDMAIITTMPGIAGPVDSIDFGVPATPPGEMPIAIPEEPGFFTRAITVFMIIYPLIFALVLLYSLIGYASFLKKLRRRCIQPHSFELNKLAELSKRAPRLIISDYATTPMLIGFFRPVIVLPNREYTEEQLHSILLHELTHMRRFDVAVKWLALLACAMHWFNPLVWITRREIDSACELSCDEAVIRDMDTFEKQHYGDTLITVASDKKIPLPVLSTTMCAEKRAIKERLTAIMKNKKHTKLAILASTIIILAAILTACALGAAGGGADSGVNEASEFTLSDGFAEVLREAVAIHGISDDPRTTGVADAWLIDFNADGTPELLFSVRADYGWVVHYYVYGGENTPVRWFEGMAAPFSTGPTSFSIGVAENGAKFLREFTGSIRGSWEYFFSFENGPAYVTLSRYAVHNFDYTADEHYIEFMINGADANEASFETAPQTMLSIVEFMSLYEDFASIPLAQFEVYAGTAAIGGPRTIQDYVDLYIENLAQGQNVGIFAYGDPDSPVYIRPANIIDIRINTLEKEAEFDDILPVTVELWRLDFMVQTDDLESETLRWGTFSPDAEGWVGHHTGWNEARTLLVFTRDNDNLALLGGIPWWMEETPYGLEGALQTFLANESIALVSTAELCHCGEHYVGENLRWPTPPLNIREWNEVDDEFLNNFQTIHTLTSHEQGGFERPYWLVSQEVEFNHHTIILWPDERLRDFRFVALGFNDDDGHVTFYTREILFRIGELAPNDAVALNVSFLHYLIPRGGIIFYDARGERRKMLIHESMRGGCFPLFNLGIHDETHFAGWSESPFVERDSGVFIVHGFGGHVSYNPQAGHMGEFYFAGNFPAPGLENESIEGMAIVTQDSLRIHFEVARNDIILEFTDGPLGTLAGPGVSFEYLPGLGITGLTFHPFEFQNGHEPLHFDFTEENAIAFGQMVRQWLHLIDAYINSAS